MLTVKKPPMRSTVAGKPVVSSKPTVNNSTDLCTTVTLVRGRVYFYKNVEYKRGVKVPVDDPVLLKALSKIYVDVQDKDKEVTRKYLFQIDTNQPRPKVTDDEDE